MEGICAFVLWEFVKRKENERRRWNAAAVRDAAGSLISESGTAEAGGSKVGWVGDAAGILCRTCGASSLQSFSLLGLANVLIHSFSIAEHYREA